MPPNDCFRRELTFTMVYWNGLSWSAAVQLLGVNRRSAFCLVMATTGQTGCNQLRAFALSPKPIIQIASGASVHFGLFWQSAHSSWILELGKGGLAHLRVSARAMCSWRHTFTRTSEEDRLQARTESRPGSICAAVR